MERNLYQRYELEAYLGEHIDDFDVGAIVDEATELDCRTGIRYWRDEIDLAGICERHDKRSNVAMTYRFESANAGTVEISVVGDYENGCKDIDACFDGGDRSWEETDDADEVMQWLVDEGVEFESDRSMAFNRAYIQSVLIDRDRNGAELLDEAAAWTDGDIARMLQFIDR